MSAAKKPRAVSCGCCDGGCVCGIHQDAPRGFPPVSCAYHKEHGHPRVTEGPTGALTIDADGRVVGASDDLFRDLDMLMRGGQ